MPKSINLDNLDSYLKDDIIPSRRPGLVFDLVLEDSNFPVAYDGEPYSSHDIFEPNVRGRAFSISLSLLYSDSLQKIKSDLIGDM